MKFLQITLPVCALNLACAMAFAQTADVSVPFNSLPDAVQNKLVDEVQNIQTVRNATVTMSIGSNGFPTYTGRVTGADGAIQTITVDERGNLIESHKMPGSPFALPGSP